MAVSDCDLATELAALPDGAAVVRCACTLQTTHCLSPSGLGHPELHLGQEVL
jgi:hypothetical protein